MNQDPWLEHAKWFWFCPYLLKMKGQNFIDSAVKLRKGRIFDGSEKTTVSAENLENVYPTSVCLGYRFK